MSRISDSELVCALRSDMCDDININGEYTDINSCVICGIQWRDDSEDSNDTTLNEGMIGCDDCNRWYHGCCIGLDVDTISESVFYCDKCRQQRGMSLNHKNVPVRNLRTERLQQIDALLHNKHKRSQAAKQIMYNKQSEKGVVFNKLMDSLRHNDHTDTDSSDDSSSDSESDHIHLIKQSNGNSDNTVAKQSLVSRTKRTSTVPTRPISRRTGSSTSTAAVSTRLTGTAADSTRSKVRETLSKILNDQIGTQIELVMYESIDNNAVAANYRQYFRDLVANLRDVNNSQLQQRILSGQLTAQQLVHMTAAELGSPEIAQLRQAIKADSLKMSILPADSKHTPPTTISQIKRYDDTINDTDVQTTDNITIDTTRTITPTTTMRQSSIDTTASPHQPIFTEAHTFNDHSIDATELNQLQPLQSFDDTADLHDNNTVVELPLLEKQSPTHKPTSTRHSISTHTTTELSEHLTIQHREIWTGTLSASHTLTEHHTESLDIALQCVQLSGHALSTLPLPAVLHERHRISIVDVEKYVSDVHNKSSSKRVVSVAFDVIDATTLQSVQYIVEQYGTERAMVFDYQHVNQKYNRCLLYVMSNNAASDQFLHTVLNISRPTQPLYGICVVPVDVCIQWQVPYQSIPMLSTNEIQIRQQNINTSTPPNKVPSNVVDPRTTVRPSDPRAKLTTTLPSNTSTTTNTSIHNHDKSDSPHMNNNIITTNTVQATAAPTTESLSTLSTYLQNLVGNNNSMPIGTAAEPSNFIPVQYNALPAAQHMHPPPLTPEQFAALQAQRYQHSTPYPPSIPHLHPIGNPTQYIAPISSTELNQPSYHTTQHTQLQRNPYDTSASTTHSLYNTSPAPTSYITTVVTGADHIDKRAKHQHSNNHPSVSIEPRLARLLLEHHMCKFYFSGKCNKDFCNYSHDNIKYQQITANMYNQ